MKVYILIKAEYGEEHVIDSVYLDKSVAQQFADEITDDDLIYAWVEEHDVDEAYPDHSR